MHANMPGTLCCEWRTRLTFFSLTASNRTSPDPPGSGLVKMDTIMAAKLSKAQKYNDIVLQQHLCAQAFCSAQTTSPRTCQWHPFLTSPRPHVDTACNHRRMPTARLLAKATTCLRGGIALRSQTISLHHFCSRCRSLMQRS